jgi:nucleoid DNA-binding protein
MKNLNFYIAYLLTKHECVIIPEFGAFVVFSVSASKKEIEGVLCPPAQSLGFNPEIKHNDGLLTHFLSERETISYKEADRFVKQYVNRLNEQLSAAKTVVFKWIGCLSISSDNKIIFTPDTCLSCNAANFGFNNFYLPQLKELEPVKESVGKEEKDPVVVTISFSRQILTRTASIAAVALTLFLVPAPLNKNSGQYISNASFFPVYHIAGTEKEIETIEKPQEEKVLLISDNAETLAIENIDNRTNNNHYYIIIASLPTKSRAEKALVDFKNAGFSDAAILSKEGRHRIAIKSFEEKAEAESYLTSFRRNNPTYTDAWLFKHS